MSQLEPRVLACDPCIARHVWNGPARLGMSNLKFHSRVFAALERWSWGGEVFEEATETVLPLLLRDAPFLRLS